MDNYKTAMITFEQALQLISAAVNPLVSEKVSLMHSLNRILAEDVASDTDMPPFDKAAMDGFACRKADLVHEMQISRRNTGRKDPCKAIGANQCAPDYDRRHGTCRELMLLLMKEYAEVDGHGCSSLHTGLAQMRTFVIRGEDIKAGEIILRSGTKLEPAQLALLAAAGYTE